MRTVLTALATLAISACLVGCGQAQTSSASGAPAGGVSIRQACGADIQKLCAGVDRSGIRQCMTDHAAQLSAGCKAAIAARRAAMAQQNPGQ